MGVGTRPLGCCHFLGQNMAHCGSPPWSQTCSSARLLEEALGGDAGQVLGSREAFPPQPPSASTVAGPLLQATPRRTDPGGGPRPALLLWLRFHWGDPDVTTAPLLAPRPLPAPDTLGGGSKKPGAQGR